MSFNFPLADVISRLNVAARSHVTHVKVEYNKLTVKVLELLYSNGLINSYSILGKNIEVELRYRRGVSIFSSIKLVSKPSKRIFLTLNRLDLQYRCNNFGGFYIVSTPDGLFTSFDCLAYKHASGEVLLKILL